MDLTAEINGALGKVASKKVAEILRDVANNFGSAARNYRRTPSQRKAYASVGRDLYRWAKSFEE